MCDQNGRRPSDALTAVSWEERPGALLIHPYNRASPPDVILTTFSALLRARSRRPQQQIMALRCVAIAALVGTVVADTADTAALEPCYAPSGGKCEDLQKDVAACTEIFGTNCLSLAPTPHAARGARSPSARHNPHFAPRLPCGPSFSPFSAQALYRSARPAPALMLWRVMAG